MMTGTKKILIITAAGIVLLGGMAAGVIGWVTGSNAVKEPGAVFIPEGTTFDALRDSVNAHGGVKFERAFAAYSKRIGLTQRYVKPGHYVLKTGMNVIEIARMFKLGNQTPVNVIIRTSRLPGQIAVRVANQIEADSTAMRVAMNNPELLRETGFDNELELVSLFIPNTYEVWWTVTPEDFIRRMKREYDRFWNDEREEKLARTGLTRMELITLASIIAEETNKTDEMPTMAGVYLNRLKKGMPLQACPTVKYALGDFALQQILTVHTKVDSPYNTYKNKGLPPTPICTPAATTIDAVLNYEDHNYWYFCAKEDFSGYHNYASSYKQHKENSRRYNKELAKLLASKK